MFNLHDFVLDTILKMIGNVADYNVQRYAVSYYEKELLTNDDMLLIQSKIEEQYKVVEEPIVEEKVVEDSIIENIFSEETSEEENNEISQ